MPLPAAQLGPGTVEQGQRRGDIVVPPFLVGHLHRSAVFRPLELLPRDLLGVARRLGFSLRFLGVLSGLCSVSAIGTPLRARPPVGPDARRPGPIRPSPSPLRHAARRRREPPRTRPPPPARTPTGPASVARAAASAAPGHAPAPVPPAGRARPPPPATPPPPRHLTRVGGPLRLLRRQAALAQRHQLRLRPASVQPAKGVVQLRPRRQLSRGLRIGAAKGGLPVRTTHRIAPRPNTSVRASICSTAPMACSGGMNAGVPSTLPACVPSSDSRTGRIAFSATVAPLRSRRSAPAGGAVSTLASPQSMTCTSPKAPTMTLAGFRSRWITSWAWA